MVTGTVKLTPGIFKAYDIRGVLGATLDNGIAYQIGQAFGSAAVDCGEHTVVIGRDGRLSGPDLSEALAAGLQAAGVDVIDIGMVATPMLYFATHTLGANSGIMVTGSHNPPDYNGFKMVLAGAAIYGDRHARASGCARTARPAAPGSRPRPCPRCGWCGRG